MDKSVPATRIRQLPSLTGIRGIGALWVFVHHWVLFRYGSGHGVHFLAVGYLGVDMFFLLSGFIMVHSKYNHFASLDLRGYFRFTAERITRLYPTNAAVMILFLFAFQAVPLIADNVLPYQFSAFSFVTSLLFI